MKVFLSYASADEKLAWKLTKHLESSNIPVWFDQANVHPGENWAAKIGEAMEDSDIMAVLVTPNFDERGERELEFALSSKRYRGRVVPIIVGDPQNMPWILRKLKAVHLDRTFGPEALDGLVNLIRSLEPSNA